METIKNYLESMFRGLPQTDKVMKAKSELLQMMEDKYTELIRSGKTENEAVGEVIQNFGNLDDLAEDLGIKEILHQTKYSDSQRKKLSFEEVTEYLAAVKRAVVMKASGIFLCIICVIFPIMADAFRYNDVLGVIMMFVSVGAGIVLISLSGSITEPWRFLKYEPCTVDAVSIDYLKNKIRDFTPTYSVLSSVGVLLCILCFIPALIFDEYGGRTADELSGALLFVLVGAGVFMMVYAKQIKRSFLRLLNINDQVDFDVVKPSVDRITNKTVRVILSVYWSVITCIYLCVSFLTFRWEFTWLIWPIAAATFTIIKAIFATESDEEKKSNSEIQE